MRYLCLLFALLTISAAAQTADQRAVSGAVSRLTAAMIAADSASLSALTAEQLSYGHSSGRVERKAEFIHSLISGTSDFVTIETSEQTITISGRVAVVRHILSATTNDSGQPGSTRLRVLQIWQKQKGTWLLLARQAVKYL